MLGNAVVENNTDAFCMLVLITKMPMVHVVVAESDTGKISDM